VSSGLAGDVAGQPANLDPQVAAYLEGVAGAPPLGTVPPAEMRAAYDTAAPGLFGRVDDVAAVEEVDAGGVPARLYRPSAADARALVYLHGGGWVVGSPDSHDGITRALAARSACAVVSVDYRLAPEHPFPAGLEDARAATRWALAGFGRVAVGGDSSGATLAAVVARELPVAAQLLICPALEHRFDTASYEQFATGYALTRDAMRWYWSQYLGDADGGRPDASPLRASDLAGLPPAIVVVAECDPLRDDGLRYAERLEAAGVTVTLLRYEGMIHNFVRFAAVIDRASAALDDIARKLAARLGEE
jgi:acetyl esterase